MTTCSKCAERTEDSTEYFNWAWGGVIYNIDKAPSFITPERIVTLPVSSVSEWVDYPRQSNGIHIAKRHVNEDHLDHVDLSEPIFFAPYPPSVGYPDCQLLIDGSHRIARCIRDQVNEIKAFTLSMDEVQQIWHGRLVEGKRQKRSRR